MRAVILAAGFARRMRPLSDATHKTLLQVAGRTIIGRIMDGLIANGIREAAIVTGYRAEELTGHLQTEYPEYNFRFIHNARYRETNNIHSLALAFEQFPLDEGILLIESDLIFEPSVLTRLLRSPDKDVAPMDHYRTDVDDTVVSLSGGIVSSVIPPHLQQQDFSFAGKYKTLNIYKLSNEPRTGQLHRLLIFYARFINDNCYYALILGMLIYMRQAQIHAEVTEGNSCAEVDDPNDLHAAEFIFDQARRGAILGRTMGGYRAYRMLGRCFADLSVSAAPVPRCAGLDSDPHFGEYKAAFPQHDSCCDDGHFDIAVIAGRAQSAAVVVFVTPNNPIGTMCQPSEITAFARAHPGKTIIVDESFLAFHTAELCGSGSVIRLPEREPIENIHIICSLSKTLGIPGVWLGYTYSRNAAFLREPGADLPVWNLNSLAEYVMEISLKHRAAIEDSLRATAADRDVFRALLLALDSVKSVWQSGGNFLLVRLHLSAEMAAPGGVSPSACPRKISSWLTLWGSRFVPPRLPENVPAIPVRASAGG
jgi:choline kinase